MERGRSTGLSTRINHRMPESTEFAALVCLSACSRRWSSVRQSPPGPLFRRRRASAELRGTFGAGDPAVALVTISMRRTVEPTPVAHSCSVPVSRRRRCRLFQSPEGPTHGLERQPQIPGDIGPVMERRLSGWSFEHVLLSEADLPHGRPRSWSDRTGCCASRSS
jgi:hypothetical protein